MADGLEIIVNLNPEVQQQIDEKINAALLNACLLVEASAREKAPVGDSGELRRSITHEVEEGTHTGYVGTNCEYAPYVEIGTGIYSSKGDGRKTPWKFQMRNGEWVTTQGSSPQPFLEPAANENTNNILKCFEGLI